MIEIVPGTLAHWRLLSANPREEQCVEASQAIRLEAEQGVAASIECYTALLNGVPFCMWGIRSLSLVGGEGMAWMIASADIRRAKMEFLRKSRRQLRKTLAVVPTIRCWVAESFGCSVAWLHWMGFKEIGRDGEAVLLEVRA